MPCKELPPASTLFSTEKGAPYWKQPWLHLTGVQRRAQCTKIHCAGEEEAQLPQNHSRCQISTQFLHWILLGNLVPTVNSNRSFKLFLNSKSSVIWCLSIHWVASTVKLCKPAKFDALFTHLLNLCKKKRGKQWEKCECKSVEKSRNFWEGSVEKSWCAPHAPHRLITQRVFIVSLTVCKMNSDDKANGNDNRSASSSRQFRKWITMTNSCCPTIILTEQSKLSKS